MTFVKVASANDIPPGNKKEVTIKGESILVANVDGKYYAINNICPHGGCKLSFGALKGADIDCPCHGSVFDVKAGSVLKGPATKAVRSFKVKVEKDQILVDA
ncbi:MAG: non-heme iron oxygenase ferredoxin subunit [Candidatus Aenigmatarchaeota archaeon]